MDRPPPTRLSASLKGFAGTVLTLLQVRLELLSIEAQEEVVRVVGLLLWGVAAVLLLAMGLGLQQLLQQWPALTHGVAWFGVAFLLYMAYGLARSDGQLSGNDAQQRPSLFKGALMQWLNPKAWLASMAGMGAYAADGDLWRVGQFAALYFVICYLSISCWALAGVYLRQYLENPLYLRRFNRGLALLLVLSAVYLLV